MIRDKVNAQDACERAAATSAEAHKQAFHAGWKACVLHSRGNFLRMQEALKWIELDSRDGSRADFAKAINQKAREGLGNDGVHGKSL